MVLLEEAIKNEDANVSQIFRLKMIDDGFSSKIKYAFHVVGDMYYLATSKVAIVDTYSIAVSCLNHKSDLKVIQMWHALGAIKKFGLQALGTKEGRDEKVSRAMCMHKNYDYVLAPSSATAEFYMQAFGVDDSKVKICSMPRVDYIVDSKPRASEFYSLNPGMGDKKIVLYLPTFREREAYIAQMLKVEFEDKNDYQLIISTHPLSKVKKDEKYIPQGDFSTYDLMKIADVIITDYSACAFEASLLMKPLYFFVPDYEEYMAERGINVDVREELPFATFDDAQSLYEAINGDNYDLNGLYQFKEKYIQNSKNNNSELLAKFIIMLMAD
jgi:CDP-ribitol ribitolphosphotransferase